jgi:hypothetical protein
MHPTQAKGRTPGPRVPNHAGSGPAGRKNGELISLAEGAGFDLFLTMDKGLQYRQNLAHRNIAILIIRARSNRLADLLPHMTACRSTMSSIQPGQVMRVGE